ncbi:ABC transporter substrate-binding protein [Paenibacillus lignilyticus]|uniref:ABC transporter substrate-binding protein n=1 Tax=Paenibacillus lignilyticus TaxID=1172615 RepID=A0ABS5CCE1_9BACL|nr:ABC transporter substrate-binding protein [Paenibacillus lignilyticus]MBP3962803.1 ABC transporter substrate-binding protein [Paenibacillus lignilyticus]
MEALALKPGMIKFFIAALSVSLVLTGCGGTNGENGTDTTNTTEANNASTTTSPDNTESPDNTASQDSGEKVTLDFWGWGGKFQTDYTKIVLSEFEKQHPNIKVKYIAEQGIEKLTTLIAGGTPPDVALLDRFMAGAWAAKGSLESLNPYLEIDGEVSADDYYPSVWAEGNYKGELYAMPFGTDNRAMYYNKTLMKEAGLDPEKPPTTISELDAAAEKIFKKTSSGYEQVGFIPWMNQGFLYTQGWNFGGEWAKGEELTPNDPQIVKALEWMAGYAKKYDMAKINKFNDVMGKTGINPFWTGKVGFVFDGNWILNDLTSNAKVKPTFEWGVAPMPSEDGYAQTTWAGGWSWVMPKGAKHPKESWELLKFIAGYDGTLLWGKRADAGNDITAMPKVNEELKITEKERLKVFVGLMEIAHTRPVTPAGQKLWDETFKASDAALNGKGEPKKLLDEAKKNVDNELKKLTGK